MLIIYKLLMNYFDNIHLYLMIVIFNETTQSFCKRPWCTRHV